MPRMATVSALVEQRTYELAAGAEPSILPAKQVLLAVPAGSGQAEPLLNGKAVFQRFGSEYITTADLTRSAGFQRLSLPGSDDIIFGTEDSKLTLEGVAEMLNLLAGVATTWWGSMFFSDGSQLLHAPVVFAWLRARLPRFTEVLNSITAAPLPRRATIHEVASVGGRGRVVSSRTLALIRKSGRDYLENDPDGVIKVRGETYTPRRVVRQRHSSSIDTPAHHRLVRTVERLITLSKTVEAAAGDPETAEIVTQMRRQMTSVFSRSAISHLDSRRGTSWQPATEEIADPRYRYMFDFAKDLAGSFGWSPTSEPMDRYSHVAYADAIFQRFAAYVFAEALGMTTTEDKPTRPPEFQSPEWRLLCDIVPARSVVSTWRSYTPWPDALRPDLTLVNRDTGKVLIADAKYRRDGSGPPENARREVASYMEAYGFSKAMLIYPTDGRHPFTTRRIEFEDRVIVEVGLHPSSTLIAEASKELPALVAELCEAPRWQTLAPSG